MASGLYKEDDVRQVSTLLYCLGEEADDILTSTNITDDDRKKYSEVMTKFDGHFKVRKNVIFERARFNRREQEEGETVEHFIASLYQLSEDCQYAEMRNEMIRDRLVVGIRDVALSERLQTDENLTLDKAKKLIRQRDAVREQQTILKRGENSSLNYVGKRPFGRQANRSSLPNCSRCGKTHQKNQCPAKDITCYKCQRRGHFGKYRFSKTVATVSEENLPDDSSETSDSHFLDAVSDQSATTTTWHICVKVNGKEVVFKIDTSAEVTAISKDVYKAIGHPKLQLPSKVLCGPNKQPLNVLGRIAVHLVYKQRSLRHHVYVIDSLNQNLLGLPAILALNILSRVDDLSSTSTIPSEFPDLFQGLGTLKMEYAIKLKGEAKPYALSTARRIPIPLRDKVEHELKQMEATGVISKVSQPTDWCAGMVVVQKKSGNVRICVDMKPLNENVLRETHPMPHVDDTLAQLAGTRIFSKLDANSGFWQIPLTPSCRHFTTFITPFGRYWFNKLPFGISSAPEVFQKQMSTILEGLPGVLCHLDDILVYGKDTEEHDSRLKLVLAKIRSAGLTLNPSKCEFMKSSITFLGHVINEKGISADPQKLLAIKQMSPPSNVKELRRFMGVVNQLGKFSPNVAETSAPLRKLLSTKTAWLWGPEQETSFKHLISNLTTPTILTFYNPMAPTKISADASSYGLGAVLLQSSNSKWHPVAYASRAMSDTESHYAQIEKEALALTWACEKFSCYILGKHVILETDHKPLVPILSYKQLDDLPPRVLRFRLILMRFDYDVIHVPGKYLYTADMLSRSPLQTPSDERTLAQQAEAEYFIQAVTHHLPASEPRLNTYRQGQANDSIVSKVITYCQSGWPHRLQIPENLRPYWAVRGLYEDNLAYTTTSYFTVAALLSHLRYAMRL